MSDGRPYTPVTLAERWDCSTAHIYNLLNSKALSGFKLGKLWRIPVEAVAAYESGAAEAPEPAQVEPEQGVEPQVVPRTAARLVRLSG